MQSIHFSRLVIFKYSGSKNRGAPSLGLGADAAAAGGGGDDGPDGDDDEDDDAEEDDDDDEDDDVEEDDDDEEGSAFGRTERTLSAPLAVGRTLSAPLKGTTSLWSPVSLPLCVSGVTLSLPSSGRG